MRYTDLFSVRAGIAYNINIHASEPNQMILVTGGTGYIGSQTCVTLAQAGHDLLIFDNLCNSRAVQ